MTQSTQPPLIPRSVLFDNPDKASPAISPDGTLLGYIAPEDGVLNVWVGPLDGSAPARTVTADRDRGVRMFAFAHDDRHLLYLQDTGGDESWRLYLVDLTAPDPIAVSRCVTPASGVQARIIGHNRWHRTTILIALNDRQPELHDVHSLDLVTGELSLVAQNPGFADWLIDSDLQIRGGVTMTPDGGVVVHLGRDGDYRSWREIPPEDAGSSEVVGFTRSGALLMTSSIGRNATALERHDLAAGTSHVLAEDAEYDVADVWQDPETLEVQAVEFTRDRQDVVLLDAGRAAGLDADLEVLRGLARRECGEADLGVGRRERSGRYWTVSFAPSDGPMHFWIYDQETKQARYLFPHRTALVGVTLAPMEPFSFTARDGLVVHGYVTFPPGLDRRSGPDGGSGPDGTGLPMVLDVHGGPWVRDTWGFNAEVQWLANRGYLCMQVNYRGSTGYGKAFTNAGDKQWGRAMQDDLTDAVEYGVAQGWADRERVGIYGGSYGGYAVLAGAAFTPDVYRCGVDIVGPSNLLTLLASVPDYWKPVLAMMFRRVGHLENERDMLWERSPLSAVDQIKIPLLIVQGANDPRVKQAEAEQIVAALKDKALPYDYVLFEDEGHGLAKPQNRERYYAAAERFLAEHLGGRIQED